MGDGRWSIDEISDGAASELKWLWKNDYRLTNGGSNGATMAAMVLAMQIAIVTMMQTTKPLVLSMHATMT